MAISGTTFGPEMLVELDRDLPSPLHRQFTDQLRDAIRTGRLAPNTRLPSTRVLAADLGVSRRLVVDGYGQLVAEGLLLSRHGSGTHVARIDKVSRSATATTHTVARYDVDFTPGSPDLGSFPRAAWLRALRQGLASAPRDWFGYGTPQGLAATRAALADYLRRTRAVLADPERIVMCSGVTQGISILAQVLRYADRLPMAVEDPGFWLHRLILQHNAIQTIGIKVDQDGLDVAVLAASPARAVLTTPAHQSPSGVVVTAARRTELLQWARAGNLVIEDDYDAEYRYDRVPVGALQGIAPDRVIYLGSASKTLAPGLRLGWMVLPPDLVGPTTLAKGLADTGNSVTDQIAFTQLLNSGDYDRHLRQMRRRYAARHHAMLDALRSYLPQVTVLGAAAGVQLAVCFPAGYDGDELVARAEAARVKVEPLAPCYTEHSSAAPGLILGYANLTEGQIVAGIQALADALRA